MCNSCLWCDLGFTVICVWLWGYFCSCPLGLTHLASVPSSGMSPAGMGAGTPSEGRFLGLQPLSPEAWMHVLQPALAHLSPAC